MLDDSDRPETYYFYRPPVGLMVLGDVTTLRLRLVGFRTASCMLLVR